MSNIGWPEIVFILVVAVLIFGARRLPEIGKGLGKGLREFRQATKGLSDDVKSGMNDEAKPESDQAPKSKDAADS